MQIIQHITCLVLNSVWNKYTIFSIRIHFPWLNVFLNVDLNEREHKKGFKKKKEKKERILKIQKEKIKWNPISVLDNLAYVEIKRNVNWFYNTYKSDTWTRQTFSIFWYALICNTYIMRLKQYPLCIASLWAWFESHTDECQCSLIWQLMLYEFEESHNTAKATKNICWVKRDGTADHTKVIRWFEKFCLSSKNHNNQAKSGRLKRMDSKVNLSLQWFVTFMTSTKASTVIELYFILLKYCWKQMVIRKFPPWNMKKFPQRIVYFWF